MFTFILSYPPFFVYFFSIAPVSWGVEKAFREGKVRYNYAFLYGYKKGADGKPEIIPEEAETVKQIFKLYLDGMSMRKIANHLNDLKIPTKRNGKGWTEGSILSILSNEKYVGDAILQKTYIVDCITHKAVKNKGERAKYLVTDAHKAIIDRDTYNLVQQELLGDRQNGRKAIKR